MQRMRVRKGEHYGVVPWNGHVAYYVACEILAEWILNSTIGHGVKPDKSESGAC